MDSCMVSTAETQTHGLLPQLQLDELAPDILIHILLWLPTRDLARVATTCRRFYAAPEPGRASLAEEVLRQRAHVRGLSVPDTLPHGVRSWVPYLLRREWWRGAEQRPIAAAKVHSLFVDESGSLWSCGCEFDDNLWIRTPGVLGLGQPPPGVDEGSGCGETVLPRRMPGMEGVRLRSVAARHGHCLALDVDGRVLSWGGGRGGRLGHGNDEDQLTPRMVAALEGIRVRSVDAGTGHSIAVSEEGALFTWGGFVSGSCGLGYRAEAGIQTVPRRVTGALAGLSVASASAGAGFTLAVAEDGGVWSFGRGETGQLGHGVLRQVIQPRRVEALAGVRIRAVAAGSSHALGLTETGVVYSWGNANSGRESLLGRRLRGGAVDAAPGPVEGMAGEHVCSIAVGDMHSCALTERGELFTWGEEEWGKLGHSAAGAQWGRRQSIAGFALLPKRVKAPAGRRLVSVSAGAFHTLVVAGDGAVFGWGDHRNGCISSKGAAELPSRPSRCGLTQPQLIAELRADPAPCARLV